MERTNLRNQLLSIKKTQNTNEKSIKSAETPDLLKDILEFEMLVFVSDELIRAAEKGTELYLYEKDVPIKGFFSERNKCILTVDDLQKAANVYNLKFHYCWHPWLECGIYLP